MESIKINLPTTPFGGLVDSSGLLNLSLSSSDSITDTKIQRLIASLKSSSSVVTKVSLTISPSGGLENTHLSAAQIFNDVLKSLPAITELYLNISNCNWKESDENINQELSYTLQKHASSLRVLEFCVDHQVANYSGVIAITEHLKLMTKLQELNLTLAKYINLSEHTQIVYCNVVKGVTNLVQAPNNELKKLNISMPPYQFTESSLEGIKNAKTLDQIKEFLKDVKKNAKEKVNKCLDNIPAEGLY